VNETDIYLISCSIVPGYVVGLEDRHVILISRMQGIKGAAEQIQQATKKINEISPQAILFAVLQGTGTALGIRSIAGVGEKYQCASGERDPVRFEKTYDRFFISLGARLSGNGFYHVDVAPREKPLNLVKSGHRLRTKAKRQVKMAIREAVAQSWHKDILQEDVAIPNSREMSVGQAWFEAGADARQLWFYLGRERGEDADLPRSVALAAGLRRRFPADPSGYRIGAAAAREMRRFDDARRIVADASARFSGEPWLAMEAASLAGEHDEPDEAARLAAELRRRFPDAAAGYRIGMSAASKMRRYDDERVIALEAAARFAVDEAIQPEIARLRSELQASRDAMQGEVVALHSQFRASREAMQAEIGALQSQFRASLQIGRLSLLLVSDALARPTPPRARGWRGYKWRALGVSAALASWGTELLFRGRYGRGRPIAAADAALGARQWEIAARYYRIALRRNPRRAPIWVQYGHALKEAGHIRAAEAAYRTALSHDPSHADAYLQLGHALKLGGSLIEAERAYLYAYLLDQSVPWPLRELSDLGWSAAQLAALGELVAAA